jgi:hypothetical protein
MVTVLLLGVPRLAPLGLLSVRLTRIGTGQRNLEIDSCGHPLAPLHRLVTVKQTKVPVCFCALMDIFVYSVGAG